MSVSDTQSCVDKRLNGLTWFYACVYCNRTHPKAALTFGGGLHCNGCDEVSEMPQRVLFESSARELLLAAETQLQEARTFAEMAAAKYNELLATCAENTAVTCAFCGNVYPAGTPRSGVGELADHIRVCEKHPLHAAQQDSERLGALLDGERLTTQALKEDVAALQQELAEIKRCADGVATGTVSQGKLAEVCHADDKHAFKLMTGAFAEDAIRAELETFISARQRVRDSFTHRNEDGKCLCVYCTRDADGLIEHAADYEMRWFSAASERDDYKRAFNCCSFHHPSVWQGDGACVACEALALDSSLKQATFECEAAESTCQALRTANGVLEAKLRLTQRDHTAEVKAAFSALVPANKRHRHDWIPTFTYDTDPPIQHWRCVCGATAQRGWDKVFLFKEKA